MRALVSRFARGLRRALAELEVFAAQPAQNQRFRVERGRNRW